MGGSTWATIESMIGLFFFILIFALTGTFWYYNIAAARQKHVKRYVDQSIQSNLQSDDEEASESWKERFRVAEKHDIRKRKVLMVGSFVGLTVLSTLYYLSIPTAQKYQWWEGDWAADDGYVEGWNSACEFIFTHSPDSTLYYGDKAYTIDWCRGLNTATEPGRLLGYVRFVDQGPSATESDYRNEGNNAGFRMALDTVFAAQPELCYADECWNLDDLEFELFEMMPPDPAWGY